MRMRLPRISMTALIALAVALMVEAVKVLLGKVEPPPVVETAG